MSVHYVCMYLCMYICIHACKCVRTYAYISMVYINYIIIFLALAFSRKIVVGGLVVK